MGSGMRMGFDEIQQLPAKVVYTLEQNSNGGQMQMNPSPPFLPPILPQIQANLQVHPFRPRPQPTLPSILTTSIPIPLRSETPQRKSLSPVHTARFSPYERPTSQKCSPTQRAKFPHWNSNPSMEVRYQSPMRMRQEANPPPPFESLNLSLATPPSPQPPAFAGPYESRSSSANSPMSIMNLINEIPTVPVTELYSLRVRQQPQDARMCGNGLADRRHIDPPPVVQLSLNNSAMNLNDIKSKIMALHCLIYNADVDEEDPLTDDGHTRLEGNTCASPIVGPDEHNNIGAFFLFPDLSCRSPGRFRLQFRLTVTNRDPAVQGYVQPFMATTVSNVFQVSLATGPAKFPGMSESTPLTKALKAMGCNVKLRRGTSAASKPGVKSLPESDGGSDGKNKSKRRKKAEKK